MDQKKSDVRLLIVDDDPGVREPVREILEMHGYRPVTVEDGASARALVREQEFDIAMVDIMLPDADGLDLTEEFNEQHGIDVIVMTGFSHQYTYEDAVDRGASDFISKPVRLEELLLRIRRVLRERRLKQEREQMLAELERLAVTDGLTKLYNSRHFYHELEVEMGRARRYGRPLSLLLFDLDKFKQYNDKYGHIEGDKVLAAVAETARDCLRKMDMAFRYGGEEFTILLPETPGQEAETVADRLRQTIQDLSFEPEPGEKVHISVSVGVTECDPEQDLKTVVRRADAAMYACKKQGGNQVCYLPPDAPADIPE
ncbi:MAG: diguanylate cyclase [Desulfatibacillaceae bacterium]